MQMDMLHLVNLNADILEYPKAAHPLHKFFLFQLMDRATQDMDLDSTAVSANQMFDDCWILESFVLQPQGVPGAIDELAHALAAVSDAPDEM